MVSLPDEKKIKEDLDKILESEGEDEEVVGQIEGAHVVRLNAEKDDNLQLKRQVT